MVWTVLGVLTFIACYIAINWFSHRRRTDVISNQWQKFINVLRRQGISTSAYECPSDLQAQIIQNNPDLAPGTAPIIQLYLDIRYGKCQSTTTQKEKIVNFKRLVKRFVSMV